MPGSGCDKEALGWRLGGPEGDLWVSGKAQRGHRACKEGPRAATRRGGVQSPLPQGRGMCTQSGWSTLWGSVS